MPPHKGQGAWRHRNIRAMFPFEIVAYCIVLKHVDDSHHLTVTRNVLRDCDQTTPVLKVIEFVYFGILVNEFASVHPPLVSHSFCTFRACFLFVKAAARLAPALSRVPAARIKTTSNFFILCRSPAAIAVVVKVPPAREGLRCGRTLAFSPHEFHHFIGDRSNYGSYR